MLRSFLCLLLSFSLTAQSPTPIQVAVHGAAGEVDGSLTVITQGNKTYMVDCGVHIHQGEGADPRNQEIPVDPKKIDGVFITHAHADHMGRLPLLVRKGYAGPIYCTRGTERLMAQSIPMSIRMDDSQSRMWQWSKPQVGKAKRFVTAHWSLSCPWARQIQPENRAIYAGTLSGLRVRVPGGVNACSECAKPEAQKVLERVKAHDHGERVPMEGGAFTLLDAGHIPGSASVLLELGEKKFIFSGDMGHPLNPIQRPASPAPKVDALWVESTYGGQTRGAEVAQESERFIKLMAETLKAGGIVWVPAYAMDRTQKVLYLIRRAQEQGLIAQNIPVHLPSNQAIAYSLIYDKEVKQKSVDAWFRPEVYRSGSIWPATVDREMPTTELKAPCILISTTALLDEPEFLPLVETRLLDPKTRIFLVGYSDPDAPGGKLKKIARQGKDGEVEIGGKKIPVARERVMEFHFLSGHLDLSDMKAWLANQDKAKVHITCVHGEPTSLERLKKALMDEGFVNVSVAERGKAVSF
jgi:metallo-beta-lactamase family protein